MAAESVVRPQEWALEEVPDQPAPAPAAPPPNASLSLLLLALRTLGQRTIVALANIRTWLLTMFTAGSVFWLWMSIPDPSSNQLIGLGMYACFVLVINYIARKS